MFNRPARFRRNEPPCLAGSVTAEDIVRQRVLALIVTAFALLAACDGGSSNPAGETADESAGAVPLFEEVSGAHLSAPPGASRGVAWADFDSDGDPDLIVSNTSDQPNELYLNDSGVLRPVEESGLAVIREAGGRAEGIAIVDHDGDGDLDVHIVTRGAQPDLLFENDGTGSFSAAETSPLARSAGSSMACWADVDGDGWLDVFLVAYRDDQQNTLLRNYGSGRYEEVPVPGTSDGGNGRACAWGDPDDDGLPDLYVGNASAPNALLWNRGDFVFEAHAEGGPIVEESAYTYGLSWADIDGDGHQDLFVANYDAPNSVYLNDGTGRLSPGPETGLMEDEGGASKGHAWGDYDLDGDLDLFIANGTPAPGMQNWLFDNDGTGRFRRVQAGDLTAHADTSAGAAWADYDGDGDLDLYVANWGSDGEENRLYRNTVADADGARWIAFRLRGSAPNTAAVGSLVRLFVADRPLPLVRWHQPTTGYASQNESILHFGLGASGTVDSVMVRWPGGASDRFIGLEVGNVWTLEPGGSTGG